MNTNWLFLAVCFVNGWWHVLRICRSCKKGRWTTSMFLTALTMMLYRLHIDSLLGRKLVRGMSLLKQTHKIEDTDTCNVIKKKPSKCTIIKAQEYYKASNHRTVGWFEPGIRILFRTANIKAHSLNELLLSFDWCLAWTSIWVLSHTRQNPANTICFFETNNIRNKIIRVLKIHH